MHTFEAFSKDPASITTAIEPTFRSLLRSLRWAGYDIRRRADVTDDLRQVLLLDCVAHRKVLATLSAPHRRERWLRLLAREYYRLCRRHRRAGASLEPDACADLGGGELAAQEPWRCCDALPNGSVGTAKALVANGESLRNGKLNARATARVLRCPERHVRAAVDRLGMELGRDQEHVWFWRRRLAESLLGLASDLLRDEALVHVHEHRRARPDPSTRMRRIERARQILRACAVPQQIAQVLRRRLRQSALTPLGLLADARTLWPAHPALPLWTFEAAVAVRDLAAAARALREARRLGGGGVPIALARARLLEIRGKEFHARRLLARTLHRHPKDARIVHSLIALSS